MRKNRLRLFLCPPVLAGTRLLRPPRLQQFGPARHRNTETDRDDEQQHEHQSDEKAAHHRDNTPPLP